MTKRSHIALLAVMVASGASAAAQAVSNPPVPVPASNEQSGLDKVGDTMENVVTKPLKDLNIIKAKVAPAMERIMAEPYALTGIKTCVQFRSAIADLTTVLGPDVDSPEFQKKAKSPAEQALSLGESAAGSLVPFSGVIRRLSGAEAKQNYAKAAIYAGSVRRAYLKGTARGKGCKV